MDELHTKKLYILYDNEQIAFHLEILITINCLIIFP